MKYSFKLHGYANELKNEYLGYLVSWTKANATLQYCDIVKKKRAIFDQILVFYPSPQKAWHGINWLILRRCGTS